MSRQRRKGLRFNVSDGGALDSLFIALGSDCIFLFRISPFSGNRTWLIGYLGWILCRNV